MQTDSERAWHGRFGKSYTKRNLLTLRQTDALYERRYGISLSEMNMRFLAELDKGMRILEVGANVGVKLASLRRMGFRQLVGIELQRDAVEMSKKLSWTKGLDIIAGRAGDIPFKDGYFDLVFTSGLLIHIPPSELRYVVAEMHRVTNEYIWFLEYFSPEITEVKYRGRSGLLWKADYRRIFLDCYADLETVRSEQFKYRDGSGNVDEMSLLRKVG